MALATRYWLAVVMQRMGINNPNQLNVRISKEKNVALDAKCSTSFLYKKWEGHPIESVAKISLINNLVPGSFKCLTNPLWQLLDQFHRGACIDELLLYDLSDSVTHSLFEPGIDMAYPKMKVPFNPGHISAIGRLNTPDALTCLLILAKREGSAAFFIEKEIYSLFLRLVIFTPLKIVRSALYKMIYKSCFIKTKQQLNDCRIVGLPNVMAFASDSSDHIELYECFSPGEHSNYLRAIERYYIDVTDHAVQSHLINDTAHDRMLFTYLFNNTDRGWVQAGLVGLRKKINSDMSHGYLPQLLEQMKYLKRQQ